MSDIELQALDQKFNWHPCSQMKDYELFKPLIVQRAYDSYIELTNGKIIIDAISSWWCKSLGHNHPDLKAALYAQVEKFEHVIFANTTHETIVRLSQKLTSLMRGLDKVFYAGDGSCAIEIALKMSLHTRVIQNEPQRTQFISLKNSYHGETLGALSVSDVGLYRTPYAALLFEPVFIEPLYVASTDDPQWNDASEHWSMLERSLDAYCNTATAIVIEPILQGAGGMLLYSQDFLSRLATWAKLHNIHLIADEIMTGMGRTGKMLACEHANIQPDFVCLSKGLTSGWIAFSAVLTTNAIYEIFYDDYQTGKSFLHSHTYSGNALGASLALATLEVIEKNKLCDRANQLQFLMRSYFEGIASKTGFIKNIRGIGAVIAADFTNPHSRQRLGYYFYQEAIRQGALLRSLGNTLYWLPPLTISEQTLAELNRITLETILTCSHS
jgi:adenosylmethionine-8-amino-7-oxononanoate aminotransferase